MSSELAYNHSRTAIFHDGSLSVYQVGSPALALLPSQDDMEKGAVQWDVFKAAKLRDLKAS